MELAPGVPSDGTTFVVPLGRYSAVLLGSRGEVLIGSSGRAPCRVGPKGLVYLLPLLEREYGVLVDELSRREDELGVPPGSLAVGLALDALPFVALAMRSDYWVGLALNWISDMRIGRYRELLSEVASVDWVSQRNRHHARRLLRDVV